jgi:hypothetical protein
VALDTMTKTQWVAFHLEADASIQATFGELKTFMEEIDSFTLGELEIAANSMIESGVNWINARNQFEDFETFDKADLLVKTFHAVLKTIIMQKQKLKNEDVFDPNQN